MKNLIVLFLMFVTVFAYGQIDNYLNYQNEINKAELSLVRGEKNKALNYYTSILSKSNGNFTKDVFNSLLLSSELASTDTFFLLLDLLIPKGIKNDRIMEIKAFKYYHSHPQWDSFLKRNKTFKGIDLALKKVIDSLHFKDQYFRSTEGSYQVYGDTINKIDSMNMEYIFQLIDKREFPGEELIGVKNFRGGQGFDIVFHHYCQTTSNNKKMPKITPVIVNLVLEGKIMPNKASHWLEMQNGEFTAGVFDVLAFKVDGVTSNFYVPEYNHKQKLLINQYRKWLGMESLDEYYEKYLFVTHNQQIGYIFDVQITVIESDSVMFNEFTSFMKELK